jgi:hypothetical protein
VTVNPSPETMGPTGNDMLLLKAGRNNQQLNILYPAKMSFRNEELKSFKTKEIRKSLNIPALKEWLNKVLRTEEIIKKNYENIQQKKNEDEKSKNTSKCNRFSSTFSFQIAFGR